MNGKINVITNYYDIVPYCEENVLRLVAAFMFYLTLI